MNPDQIVSNVKAKLGAAVDHFSDELKKLRTGRAHPSMLDGIMVEAYGTQMPLNQSATITTPEPQLLQISPFDPNNIASIVSAIRDNQSLGLNPMDDGRVVRVPIPPLTEERRRDIVKQLNQKVEDCKITARNIRHEGLKDVESAKKDKLITEDDVKRLEKQIDEAMEHSKAEVDQAASAKQQEIMKV